MSAAVRYSDWRVVGSALFTSGLLLGPFVIYYFVLRTAEFSIAIGVLLSAAAIYAGVEMVIIMDRDSSTAGLSLLWLPLIGYPLVVIGGFLDRMSR